MSHWLSVWFKRLTPINQLINLVSMLLQQSADLRNQRVLLFHWRCQLTLCLISLTHHIRSFSVRPPHFHCKAYRRSLARRSRGRSSSWRLAQDLIHLYHLSRTAFDLDWTKLAQNLFPIESWFAGRTVRAMYLVLLLKHKQRLLQAPKHYPISYSLAFGIWIASWY